MITVNNSLLKRTLIILLFLLQACLFSPVISAVQEKSVAVIYPELQEPYRSVISAILQGIQQEIKSPIKFFPVSDGTNSEQLRSALVSDQVSAIVALGRTGLSMAQSWRGDVPIVVGALMLTSDDEQQGIRGISLVGDPAKYFEYLKKIAPTVKRVHMVYSPENSNWLVSQARVAANGRSFQLVTHSVMDVKEAVLVYRDILDDSRPGEDAIWLLPDSITLDDKVIFPMLLRSAWDKDVILFSGNPTHVRRGALFALYPDNTAMGESLARMAEGRTNSSGDTIIPLRDLLSTINIRTAEHIGLNLSNELRKEFSVIFPAQ